MANKSDYVELGLTCADVCKALYQGMDGKELDDLSQPVREAVKKLTTWVEPVEHSFGGSLMTLVFVGPSRRSRRRSLRRVDGTWYPDLFIQKMTRKRLPPGSWISTGSFISSMYVLLTLLCSR